MATTAYYRSEFRGRRIPRIRYLPFLLFMALSLFSKSILSQVTVTRTVTVSRAEATCPIVSCFDCNSKVKVEFPATFVIFNIRSFIGLWELWDMYEFEVRVSSRIWRRRLHHSRYLFQLIIQSVRLTQTVSHE
jgi:hypothetical protein